MPEIEIYKLELGEYDESKVISWIKNSRSDQDLSILAWKLYSKGYHFNDQWFSEEVPYFTNPNYGDQIIDYDLLNYMLIYL